MVIFALVVFSVWGTTVHYGHAFSLVIGAVMLAFFLMPSIPMKVFGIYLSIWATWIWSSAFAGIIPQEVVTQTASMIIFIVSGLIMFLIAWRGDAPKEFYLNGICAIALTLSILGILQHHLFGHSPIGTTGNQNFLAAFVAITLPLCFRGNWIYTIPILFWTLIICHTTTAFVAAMIGIAYLLWPYIQRSLSRGVLPLCIIGIAGVAYYSFVFHPFIHSERFAFWQDAIGIILSHWYLMLFGVGPGILWQPNNMLHSEYVYMLFNFGIIGLILMAAMILSVPRTDRTLYASFITIAIDAIGNHLFHTAPTAILSVFMIALLFREKEKLSYA